MRRNHSLRALTALLFVCFAVASLFSAASGGELCLKKNDRILVLAPHPDDEAIACSGVIQEARALELPLKIVFFTYGDNNELAFLFNKKRPVLAPSAMRAMGEIRGEEAKNAAAVLGVLPESLVFLGYPDFGTLRMWYYHWRPQKPLRSMLTRTDSVRYPAAFRPGAPHLGNSVLADMENILREFQPTRIFLPHASDTNPDHLALYLYTRVALWNLTANPELHPYLVHFPGWPVPRKYLPDAPLAPPPSLAHQHGWHALQLAPEQRTRKEQALRAHATQYAYSAGYMRSFVRANELFGMLPDLRIKSEDCAPLDLLTMLTGISPIPANASQQMPSVALNPFCKEQFFEETQVFGEDTSMEMHGVFVQDNALVAVLRFSRPLVGLVHAHVHICGYRPDIDFGKMPKLRIRISAMGVLVYNGFARIPAPDIWVSRRARQITVRVPLSRLGNPDRVLLSMRATLGNSSPDWSSWRAVWLGK